MVPIAGLKAAKALHGRRIPLQTVHTIASHLGVRLEGPVPPDDFRGGFFVRTNRRAARDIPTFHSSFVTSCKCGTHPLQCSLWKGKTHIRGDATEPSVLLHAITSDPDCMALMQGVPGSASIDYESRRALRASKAIPISIRQCRRLKRALRSIVKKLQKCVRQNELLQSKKLL